ncbi:C8orf37 [Bugula neritina]|uniref:Cilia- and flagella-associated protein 418 n=1 Tax=Bugula neritina TaxID=10212 RepID=A0A7J7J8X3_BUGNE|nr:C8orf37 [Bugula neritina]
MFVTYVVDMADDIDDLLDEVEASFVKKQDSPKKLSKTLSSSNKIKDRYKDDDLNSIMDEICAIPEADNLSIPHPISHTAPVTPGSTKKRCFQLYLSGTAVPDGINTTAHQRACDSLRCTDCDFKVSTFKDVVWDSSTDYLFLRNNMPDFSRLKAKLLHKSGAKAYACQCKFRSVNKLMDVSKEKELKWVCGKHA